MSRSITPTEIIQKAARASLVCIFAALLLLLIGVLPQPVFWIVAWGSVCMGVFPAAAIFTLDFVDELKRLADQRFRPVEAARQEELETMLQRVDLEESGLPSSGGASNV